MGYKIVLFENTDDDYASKARLLYEEMTEPIDREVDDGALALEWLWNVLEGTIRTSIEVVIGLGIMLGGSVYYFGSARVLFVGNIVGRVPKWAKYHFDNGNKLMGEILNDPFILVEGLAQEASDIVDQKGISYSVGAGIAMVVGTKVTGSMFKAAKGIKAAKKVDKIKITSDVVAQSSKKVEDVNKVLTKTSYVKSSDKLSNQILGQAEIVLPSKPHTNGTQGHWETILDEIDLMKNSGDYKKIYANKGLSNEIPGAKPNIRPDVMGVRRDGIIDQVEVPSKTDDPMDLVERMIDNQRIIGDRAGTIKIRSIK